MSNDSIFSKIIRREIPATILYEDEFVIGIKDINPQAATHLLFIHRQPTTHINEMVRTSPEQVTHLFRAIEKFTEENGLEDIGFRLVTNCGASAGQSVFHTHIHVLSDAKGLGRFGA